MKDMDSQKVRDMLSFDALSEAENLTGKSYKEDKVTEAIGFSAHLANTRRRNEYLKSVGDSRFSTSEEEYLSIVKSIGFESILVIPFKNRDNVEERFHVMWNYELSILLKFDTFTYADDGSWAKAGKSVPPPSVNSGKFYYNWSPNGEIDYRIISSGCYVGNGDSHSTYSCLFDDNLKPSIIPESFRGNEPKKMDGENWSAFDERFDEWSKDVKEHIKSNNLRKVWSGDHDCREGVRFNITQLYENGVFVKKWVKAPFMWLLHYMDTKGKGCDHEEITNSRLKMLPKEVIEAMNVKL